jgi:CMP-N-acetylneuraminic acid synthetase
MTVSAILFGRKNSKGIKNKNIKKICGTPLYLHSLKEAFKIEKQLRNFSI